MIIDKPDERLMELRDEYYDSLDIHNNYEVVTGEEDYLWVQIGNIGMGSIVVHDGWGEVKNVFVDPYSRERGVGTALMQELEVIAKQKGLTDLYLEADEGFVSAIKMYERLGYEKCEPYSGRSYNGRNVFYRKGL